MMRTRAVLLVLALAPGCTSTPEAGDPPAAPESAPPAATPGEEVAIDRSYRVADAPPAHAVAVAYDSAGRLIAVGDDGAILTFDPERREVAARRSLEAKRLRAAAVVPGRLVAAVDAEGAVYALALDREGAAPVRAEAAGAHAVAVAADGAIVVVGTGGGAVEVRAPGDLHAIAIAAEAHEGEVTAVAVSPDGAHIASVGKDGALRVWTREVLARVRASEGHGALYAAAFSPDGRRVAFGGERNEVLEIDVASGAVRPIASGQPFWITTVAYRPDGIALAAGDESCDIWLYDLRAPRTVFHGKHHFECWLSSIAFTPGSDRFSFGCRPNGLEGGSLTAFSSNLLAEAALSPEVQALAAAETAALADLARASPEGATLAALLESPVGGYLLQDVEVNSSGTFPALPFTFAGTDIGGAGGGIAVFAGSGARAVVVEGPRAAEARQRVAADPAAAPKLEAADRAREAREKAIAAESSALQGSFHIPEWKLPSLK